MNGREAGFLLLTSHLGNPERKVLTVAQLRKLAQRVSLSKRMPADREMIPEDLLQLGYSRQEAERILNLLSQTEQLSWYVQKGERKGCRPITRVSECYPLQLRKRLGLDSPGCLWAKGDLSLLQTPMVALVGSRDLRRENLEFAREVGKQAALQGITLVSGNARGADQEGQSACLEHGGSVISVVADELEKPGSGALTAFERECDNALMAYQDKARRTPFGEEVVAGYLFAREAELTAIRTVMAGRMAGLSGDVIRQRLRKSYI